MSEPEPEPSSSEPEPEAGTAEEPDELDVEQKYSQLRSMCAQLNAKLGEVQNELQEHKLVVTALTPLEDSRRTFRLLGGVMVEKTKAEILPEIESNITNLSKLVESYTLQLQEQQKALRAHVAENPNGISEAASKKADELDAQINARAGVLV